MDLLPWTSNILSTFGLNEVREGEKPLKIVVRNVIICLLHSVFLGGTMYSFILVFRVNRMEDYVLMGSMIFYFGIKTYCYHDICVKSKSLYLQLRKSFGKVHGDTAERIRRREKIAVIGQLILMAAPEIALVTYVSHQDDHLEIPFFSRYASLLELHFISACYMLAFLALTWICFLYIVTVDLAGICAEDVKNKILKASKINGIPLFMQILEGLRGNRKLVHIINESLGMIPMISFALLFMYVVALTTFIILKGMNHTSFFLVFLTTLTLSNRTLATFIIVARASHTYKVMEDSIVIARQVSLRHLPQDSPFFVWEARRSLTEFLCLEEPAAFTAASMFKLDKSLVLTFINAVVPFTVMFITTIYQVMSPEASAQRDRPRISLCNCSSLSMDQI